MDSEAAQAFAHQTDMTARQSTIWLSIVAVLLNVFSAPAVVARAFGPEQASEPPVHQQPVSATTADSEHCAGHAKPIPPAGSMDEATAGGMDHGDNAGCCETSCDCGWLPVAAPISTLVTIASPAPTSALGEPSLLAPATFFEFVLRPPIIRAD